MTYNHNTNKNLSWNNLVSDYFNSRISASKDPIDLRPVLNMQIRQGGNQGFRLNTAGDDMVCLQRCTETPSPPREKQEKKEVCVSTSSATFAARPPMKKRKLVRDLTALEDMML